MSARDPSAMLSVASDAELTDLVCWADTHASATLAAWLRMVEAAVPDSDAYPRFAPVPACLVDELEALIADWEEILAAHQDEDPFNTCVTRAQLPRWEIQHRLAHNEWQNVSTDETGKPLTFETQAEAQAELQEHLQASAMAAKRGDLDAPEDPADWRVAPALGISSG
jgi:hypothetical protein